MPNGVPRRAELAPRARELRAEGWLLREIAEELGVSKQTISEWLTDPDRAKWRAKRERYRGVCESCGGPTDGSDGPGRAPKVCQGCLEWSDEAVIEAIRDWTLAHGSPPTASRDWRHAGDDHPSSQVVIDRFGWNEALLKAGCDLRCDRRPGTQFEIERMLREGVSVKDIADHFGWTPMNVYVRLRTRGLRVSDFRKAA